MSANGSDKLTIESILRAVVVALAAFLTLTGTGTLLAWEPSRIVQAMQLAHREVGFWLALAGSIYLIYHVAEVMGGLRQIVRTTPRLQRIALVAAPFLIALSIKPSPIQAPARYLGFLALFVLGGNAVLFFFRDKSVRNTSATLSGRMAVLATIMATLSGGAAASHFGLYAPFKVSPWIVHVVFCFLMMVLIARHVLVSRRRRAAALQTESMVYAWRRPLSMISLPLLPVVAYLTIAPVLEATGAYIAPSPDMRALVPLDAGFSGVEPAACVRCHPEVSQGWKASAHALSANNPFFRAVAANIRERGGAEQARFCLRCHAPHAPDPTRYSWAEVTASEGFEAGVTCSSCHRSTPGPGHGDGSFSVAPLSADGVRFFSEIPGADFDWARGPSIEATVVRNRLPLHRLQYRHQSQSPDVCLPCHVQTMHEPSGGRIDSVLQDQYESWAVSPAAREGMDCKVCHAPRYFSPADYLIADHRFLGASTYLAFVAGGEAQMQHTVDMLSGISPLASAPHLPKTETPVPAPLLEMAAEITCAAEAPALRIQTRNSGRIGHSFPNGPTDILQIWLSVLLRDGSGKTVVDLGGDGPPGVLRLGHTFLDDQGDVVGDHSLWRVAKVVESGLIPAEGWHEWSLRLPDGQWEPPLSVSARWNYRRLDPQLIAAVTQLPAPPLPIVPIGVLVETLDVPSCPN